LLPSKLHLNHWNNIQFVSLNSKIEINSLVFKYLKSIQHESVVPFGSAFPDSQLFSCPQTYSNYGATLRQRQSYDQTASLPPGNLALRKLIAQRYCMQGIQTDPDDIVITSGGLDALNLSLQAVAKPVTIFYCNKPCFTVLGKLLNV
jgi:DNA-binding transcriptional MocR family regulator